MNRKATYIAVAGASLLMAASAFAGPFGGKPDPEKMQQRQQAHFRAMDTDGSGDVSRDEFMAAKHPGKHRRAKGQARFGKPSEAEQAEMEAKAFSMVDANSDGQISADEFTTDALRKARETVGKERMFKHLDSNDDGVITEDELPDPADMAKRHGKWRRG